MTFKDHEIPYLALVKITNVEIKARSENTTRVREALLTENARFVGRDHQIDTYYQTPHGRLKLRQGNIENSLIAYARENSDTPKRSDVLLYKTTDPDSLKAILNATMEELVVVDKMREIYFIENVKFHIDEVKDLGSFIEIEAIDETQTVAEDILRDQVVRYMRLLGIGHNDLLTHSYSDMILDQE